MTGTDALALRLLHIFYYTSYCTLHYIMHDIVLSLYNKNGKIVCWVYFVMYL